ncbi:hypothetical protein DO021_14345 [Desulfobacter hydrogenophilus]|uniref:Uncharacterized protein n=2 Tax=Desulfobacter hydrogenophilus TaxID=2291 RepID=A0A328F9A8_9BACT|nr:hypothetical protein [Desulfobacter hydrogenophilus]NDY72627.1 hypothetical protein [Desulfobacter hydrogenophilus]QBH13346.1 hypothetical protein EYB58_10675 [Desulfobacter hydrogenophilus]RAM01254.1 hypothetical protein DO021_14345 [Desulfobacter hydrogenophilus]
MVTLLNKICQTPFVRTAIEDKADLSAFREKPSFRVLAGVFAIAFSYVLGWPMVGLMGIISLKTGNPWFTVIGGPGFYGLSHLVFMAGMVLSGAEYSMIFLRWLTRVSMESLMQKFGT